MDDAVPSVSAIPPGHVLLHVGLPKSGTTALQTAAAARRAELRSAGLLYPGKGINQRLALSAAMGREATGSSRPARRADWTGLLREVAHVPQRVLLSYELVCAAAPEDAARMVEELGADRVHVVVTARAQAAMLSSVWQQYVKTNVRRTFTSWAKAVLGEDPDPKVTPSFWPRHDLGEVCERWASVVGAERLTVVVLDRARPHLLPRAFEQLLDVPAGSLEASDDGAAENRSLTSAEIELVRQLQKRAKAGRLGSRWRSELLMHGVAPALQSRPASSLDAGPVPVPLWVDEAARRQAELAAETVRALGVRVVGDLDVLSSPGRPLPAGTRARLPRRISVAAVATAVAAVAELSMPGPAPGALPVDPSTPAGLVRGALEQERGASWVRRHARVLRGLEEAQASVERSRRTKRGTVDVAVAAALIAGVMSRVVGRGALFARPRAAERDPREVLRWAWVRWRRGDARRILEGLRSGR